MRKEMLSRLATALLSLCLALPLAFLGLSCHPKAQEPQRHAGSQEVQAPRNSPQPRRTRIVVSLVQDKSEWFLRAEEWALAAQKELEEKDPYLDVEVESAKDNQEQYMAMQKLLLAKEAETADAVVVLTTGNQARLQELCAELSRQKGVMVTAVSSNLVYPHNPDLLVSGDNARIGLESAKSIVNALGGNSSATGRILAITDLQDSALRIRLKNFQDQIRLYPGLRLKVVNYREEAATPKEAMKRILEREEASFDAVWTGWDGILIPVFQACQESGAKGIQIFTGAGGFSQVAKWIETSEFPQIFADYTYPPQMLQVAILATARKLRRRQQKNSRRNALKKAPEIIILPTELITSESVQPSRSQGSETF